MTVKIHDRSVVNAMGTHTHKNCETIYNATKNVWYTSTIDAAEDLGVHKSSISWALTGRSKKCKGNVLIRASEVGDRIGEITEMHQTVVEAAKVYKEKADAYDKHLTWKEEVRNIVAMISMHEARVEELNAEIAREEAIVEEARLTLAKLIEEELR